MSYPALPYLTLPGFVVAASVAAPVLSVTDAGSGVATCSVTGGTAGRAFRVYYVQWSAASGSTWTLGGSGTLNGSGAGSVNVTPGDFGYFVWYAAQLNAAGTAVEAISVTVFQNLVDTMGADSTQIMASFVSALATLYPGVPAKTSRQPVARGKPLVGGWTPGYPSTCFVVTSSEAEDVDKSGSFETVSVAYRVLVEYVKPLQQAVTGAVDGGPPGVTDDPDIRDERQLLRRTLYKTFPTVANVYDVRIQPRPVYEQSGAGDGVLVVTGAEFRVTGWENRA